MRERLARGRDRIGWWTLPMFLVVGLAGAVLSGGLAVVYYSQQVRALTDETEAARESAQRAAEEVEEARAEALEAIDEQVAAVREAVTRDLPVPDAPAFGVVSITALVGSSAPAPPPPASGEPPSGAPDPAALQEPTESPSEPAAESSPQPSPAPPPPSRPIVPRTGSGLAVARDGATTFFATTFGLIADPDAPGGVVAQVEVRTPRGTFLGFVHSWDAGRDIALVRADAGEVPIPEWRPDEAGRLAQGERLVAVGVTPTLNTLQLAGTVAFSDPSVLVTDLTGIDIPLLRGGPLTDADGRIVGLYSLDYRPFGARAGERQSAIPIRLLCERMLRNCDALEAEAPPEGEQDE